MKLTNKRNLPAIFARAADPYKRIGDVSATGLLDPVQKTVITRRFWEQVEEDVSNRLWAIFGRAVHSLFEESERSHAYAELGKAIEGLGSVTIIDEVATSAAIMQVLNTYKQLPVIEERVAIHIIGHKVKAISIEEATRLTDQPHEGLIVSGCADHIDRARRHIDDIKVTKTWAHKYGAHLPKWTEQLSIYQFIYGINLILIETASVLEMLRDWSEHELGWQQEYPEFDVYETPIDLLPEDETYALIRERGERILELIDAPLEELPPCTDEDRWADPPAFAVFGKKDAKRATKLFRVERGEDPHVQYELACDLRNKKGGTSYVEERPARNKRCEKWCSAAPFCLQWKALQKEGASCLD